MHEPVQPGRRADRHVPGQEEYRRRSDSVNYGKINVHGPGPHREKALRRFLPGSVILSVGSFWMQPAVPRQNHEISMAERGDFKSMTVSP